MGAELGTVVIQNATAASSSNGVLDMERMSGKVTFVVTVNGSLSSFSLNLQAAQWTSGPSSPYVTLQTVTAPGVYTFEADLFRYFTADLASISGGSFPANTISVTVAAE